MKTMLSKKTFEWLLTFSLLFFLVRADAQNQGPPPTVLYLIDGIRIEKSELIKAVTKFDSTMIFEQSPNINGVPETLATDQLKGALQIVGEEHNVNLAKWTFSFGDKNVNMPGLTNMGHFAFIIAGQPCVDWLVGKIKAMIKDRNSAFSENNKFSQDAIKGHLTYDPTTFTLVLSFTPNKSVH
jgi:hypothetical protein